MAMSWTEEVTGPSEVPEAAALLAVLERYHQRVVQQLAVTEDQRTSRVKGRDTWQRQWASTWGRPTR